MMIPIEEIEASYRYLYGPDAVPNHHNIEEESQGFAFEYDPDNACYHVPFTTVSANYVPVLDTLKRRKDTVSGWRMFPIKTWQWMTTAMRSPPPPTRLPTPRFTPS